MEQIKIYENIVYKPISEIKPYEDNARINDKAVKSLVEIIPVVGFNVPIVIDENNIIVKGHSRYEALKQLGIELVPCIVISGSPEDIAEERLVDNRLSELSEWDKDKLEYELKEMSIDLTKFDISVPFIRSSITEVKDVIPQDIQNEEKKLVGENRKKRIDNINFIEVVCNSCGETIRVNRKELERFARA